MARAGRTGDPIAASAPNWEDLRAVLAVVQGGTLTAAAETLGVAYTTVARRIARAEEAMGQTLFEHLADGYRPTEAGRLAAEHAADMAEAEHRLMRKLSAHDDRLSGQLTLTAPQLIIAHVLPPVLEAFMAAHPGVELNLRASNTLLDLNRREADIALRISRNPGDTLKGLRLAPLDTALFASDEVAQRIASDPVAPVDWLDFTGFGDLPDVEGPHGRPEFRVRARFDDMVCLGVAASNGLGVARMPVFLGRAMEGLVQVPILPPATYAEIWLVAHPDVWGSARVAALREILVPHIRAHRSDFVA